MKRQIWLLALVVLVLTLVTPACGETVSPTPGLTATLEPTHTPVPTSTPKPTATPEPTDTPVPTNIPRSTKTPKPTITPRPTATPRPAGEVDTGMGGSLSIQGVVRDDHGVVASDVYVTITVYEEGGGGDFRRLGEWDLYTDETGSYSFNNLLRVERGHYEVWFNGGQEYGKVYENSGYFICENDISGDAYLLNVTVHPVTGSAFCGVIQYEDADGTTKNIFSRPLNLEQHVGLNRGTSANHEYNIGSEKFTIHGSTGHLSGLAGGTYYLEFHYRRSDGVEVYGTSPSFEIPPGETRRFDYTIPSNP